LLNRIKGINRTRINVIAIERVINQSSNKDPKVSKQIEMNAHSLSEIGEPPNKLTHILRRTVNPPGSKFNDLLRVNASISDPRTSVEDSQKFTPWDVKN
jgi:hypothetical protein